MKIKVFQILKDSHEMIKKDFWRFIAVLAVAESAVLILARTIASRVFSFALINAKVAGINNENFTSVLFHPLAVILLLIWGILLAIFVVVQVNAMIAYANRRYQEERLTIKSIFKPLLNIRYDIVSLILFLGYIFVILPFGSIGISSTITRNFGIPLFILETIYEVQWMSALYFGVSAILFFLSLRYFYAFVIFYNQSLPFNEALKESWNMTRGKGMWHVIKLYGVITILSVIAFIIVILGVFAGFHITTALNPDLTRISYAISKTLMVFLGAFVISLSSIYVVQATVVSYHTQRNSPRYVSRTPRRRSLLSLVGAFFIAVTFVLTSFVSYYEVPDSDLINQVIIVGHRGSLHNAVENTLKAFDDAHNEGADYIELDIQELKDGTLVVFHDPTLTRLAGIHGRIENYTWDELKDIEISQHGFTDTIPSFEAVLAQAEAKGHKLMVEVKTNRGDSDEMLDNMMALIAKYNMTDRVIFQSLDRRAALELKEKYPDTYVGYIIGLNIGGLEKMDVDFYSIEDSSVSERVMRDAANQNKELIVWSINSEELMQVYYMARVKGIITDEVPLAKEVKERMKHSPFSYLLLTFDM